MRSKLTFLAVLLMLLGCWALQFLRRLPVTGLLT